MQLVAQVLAEHNVSAYLTGHLHGAFGQRLHRLHATPAGKSNPQAHTGLTHGSKQRCGWREQGLLQRAKGSPGPG